MGRLLKVDELESTKFVSIIVAYVDMETAILALERLRIAGLKTNLFVMQAR